MGEDKNAWDQPWSLDQMRSSSTNWSLASDAGMLQHLQEFSQRMIARTHEIQQQVNGLVHETKLSQVRVQSAFNDFIMLANTQFVENRVYDEDVAEASKSEQKAEEKEKSKEEREAELIPKITQAVKLGLGVIDSAFERLEMNAGDSDSEGEQAYPAEPLLEAKDPYIHRALPYLIGSQGFLQDDDVGLIDTTSDDDEEAAMESESESEASESGSEAEHQQAPAPRPVLDRFDSETESEDDDLFGEKKKFSEEEDMLESDEDGRRSTSGEEDEAEDNASAGNGIAAPTDFASELASKLGLPQAQPKESVPADKPKSKEKKVKKEKPEKKSVPRHDDGGDLFGAAPGNDDLFGGEDEDSPFGSGGGLFATPKNVSSLFDDDDEGGLFDDQPKPSKPVENKPAQKPAEVKASPKPAPKAKEPSPAPSPKVTKSGKKVPAGGISIFGDDGDDLFSAPPAKTSAAPTKKPALSLFDDDVEDLFASTAPSAKQNSAAPAQQQATKAAKATSLFDEGSESEEEEDLFATQKGSKLSSKSTTPQQQKKLPPGAVSIFGNAPNPLLEAMKAKQRPQTDSEHDSDWSDGESKSSQSTATKPVAEPAQKAKPSPAALRKPAQEDSMRKSSPAPSSKSLFDEDDDDDLFSTTFPKTRPQRSGSGVKQTATPEQAKKAPAVTPSGGGAALFGDQGDSSDSDDLFSTAAKPAKTQPSKSLVEDKTVAEPDDLFSAKPAASSKRKPVGGVALFGGADLFGGSDPLGTANKTQPQEPKAVEKPQPTPTQAKTVPKASPKLAEAKIAKSAVKKQAPSLFDDDSEEDDLFAKLSSKPKQAATSSKAKGASLFDEDEDDLFAITKAKPAKVEDDLFSSEKAAPKPREEKRPEPSATSSQPVPAMSPLDGDTSTPDVVTLGGATTTASTTDQQDLFSSDQQDTLEVKPKKPPAGAVSMFGGMDPSALLKKKSPEPAKKQDPDPLGGASEPQEDSDDDLFSVKPKPRPPQPAQQPKPSPREKARDPEAPATSTPVSAQQGAVSKLKSNLVFNPATMLPGAAPPVREPEPAAIGFDQPVNTQTLTSVSKDRAKIQRGRRPPSRKGRLSQAAASMSDSIVSQPPLSIQGEDDVTPKTSKKAKVTPSKPLVQSKTTTSAIENDQNDDLFAPLKTEQTKDSKLPIQTNKAAEQLLDEEDIFGLNQKENCVKSSQKSNLVADDIQKVEPDFNKETQDKVTSWLNTSEPAKKASRDSVIEENEEDKFSSVTAKPRSASNASNKTAPKENVSTKAENTGLQLPPPLKVSSIEGNEEPETDLFAKDDDDLFSAKKTKPIKASAANDDDDLFSFTKPTKPVVMEDDDDIFASSILEKNKSSYKTPVSSSTVESKAIENETATPQNQPRATARDTDDIFGDDFLSSPKSKNKLGDIFGKDSVSKTKASSDVHTDDIFGDVRNVRATEQGGGGTKSAPSDPDDIFADVGTASTVAKPFAPSSAVDDDIFAEVIQTSKPGPKAPTNTVDEEDIFADVPKKKSSKKPKKQAVKDEDIFKDDTDIFSDIPVAKPKQKKTKKKTTASKPLFSNNDVDDIFASIPAAKTGSTKKSKKAEATTKQNDADKEIVDIFDDPLNALK